MRKILCVLLGHDMQWMTFLGRCRRCGRIEERE
jgi:hypothetical protein